MTIKNVKSNLKFELFAQIVNGIAGALLVIILARLLQPDAYGLLFLTLAVIGVGRLIAKLGFDRSAARYISEYKNDNAGQVPNIIIFSFASVCFLTFLTVLVMITVSGPLSEVLNETELSRALLYGLLFLIFMTFSDYSRTIFQSFESVDTAATIELIRQVGKFLFAIFFVLMGFGVVGALLGYALGAALSAIVGLSLIYLKYIQSSDPNQLIEVGLRRRIAEYALPLTVTDAASVLNDRIDTVLVGYFLTPVAVSYYVISKQVIIFTEKPAVALGFTLAPTFSAEKNSGNLIRASELFIRSITNVLLLYIPAAVGLVIIAEPTVGIVFGEEYLGASPVLQIFSIYSILLAINLVSAKALDYLGRAKQRAIGKLVTSLLNVALNVIMIPTLGIMGAAYSTVITYSIYTAINIKIIQLELNVRLTDFIGKSFRITLASLTMGAFVYHFSSEINNIAHLLLVILLGIFVWFICSMILGLIQWEKVKRQLKTIRND